MNENERAEALKTQILEALRAQELTHFINDDVEVWTPGTLDDKGIRPDGLLPDRFAGRMARNLVSIFGDRAMSLIGPVVILNVTNNFSANFEQSREQLLKEFELMQAMNGGGQS